MKHYSVAVGYLTRACSPTIQLFEVCAKDSAEAAYVAEGIARVQCAGNDQYFIKDILERVPGDTVFALGSTVSKHEVP